MFFRQNFAITLYTAIGWEKDFSLEELNSIRCWLLQVRGKQRRSEQNWVVLRYLCDINI